ncbi:MAG: hypothetical protein K1X56_07145 [Flavobacteriales bacterium]|nr:hypothetical protein [Flavobacteriales bacterium]
MNFQKQSEMTFIKLLPLFYWIVNLTVFAGIQTQIPCDGFLCVIPMMVLSWTIFFVSTGLLIYLHPLKLKDYWKSALLLCTLVMFIYFIVYNNFLDLHTYTTYQWWIDYSVPGMLLSLAITISIYLNHKAPKA